MSKQAETPIRSFSVSIVLLRRSESGVQTLLMRKADTLAGIWCQCAGKLEAGETAWQAALRECHEETGLVPLQLFSADHVEQFYEADRDCITLVPAFVGFVDEDAKVVLNEEHDAFEWVSFEEARSMLTFDGQIAMFNHIERQFVQKAPSSWLEITID